MMLTQERKNSYNRDGYLIVRSFLSDKEVDKLHGMAIGDDVMLSHGFDRKRFLPGKSLSI
jgi:hypothetical protein